MLLDPSALRRRVPLIIFIVLASMAIGAAWAATQTPVYRSTAVVSGPTDLGTIVRSGSVAATFRTSVGASYGDDAAATTVAFASESGPRIELATESEFAGVAEDLTSLYAEAVLATQPDVVLEKPATFPLSAQSPNLRRTALITLLIGTTVGWLAAVALERRSKEPQVAAVTPTPEPLNKPEPAVAAVTPTPEPLAKPEPQAPAVTPPAEPLAKAEPQAPAVTPPAEPLAEPEAAASVGEVAASAPLPDSPAPASAQTPPPTNPASRRAPRIASTRRPAPERNLGPRSPSETPRVVALPDRD